jgi:hypothetical protein
MSCQLEAAVARGTRLRRREYIVWLLFGIEGGDPISNWHLVLSGYY